MEVQMTYNLTFEFSIEKLVRAIAFFSKQGVPDLTKLKVVKLLYFADKHSLLSHGQPIIGDVYYCMQWGPVPSYSLNEINAALSRSEVPLTELPKPNWFADVVHIKKSLFNSNPKFEANLKAYSESVFSTSELESLRHTVAVYGHKTAKELVDLTHKEPTWKIPNQGRAPGSSIPISYDLFFEGASDVGRRYFGKLVAEQYGIAIPLAGDVDYRAFANELASHSLVPEEVCEPDVHAGTGLTKA
jgi:uncharacterized phage-associated protein